MAVMNCPHCGAENFTMEGWEDLDHCSSCGKPLGESVPNAPLDADLRVRGTGAGRGRFRRGPGQRAEEPRDA